MPPTANFSGAPRSPSVGQAVQFQDLSRPGTAAVNQWLWDFGDPDSNDDNLSNLQNPTHIYNAPGFYTVTLTVRTPVTTDNSDTEVKTAYIQVVQAPTPGFSFDVTDPDLPNVIQFTNETVLGSEPVIATLWTFGDPGSVTNTSQSANPTHEFSTDGNFTVTLTVKTASREVSIAQVVNVVFNPPTVDFSVQTDEDDPREGVLTDGGLTTETLQFVNLTTPGTETAPEDFTYDWDFGDGTAHSTLEEPTHTFENGGNYTVILTVTTPTSVTTATHIVAIDEPPLVDFDALPRIANANVDILFFDNSDDTNSQPIEGRLWNFGDSFVATGENPTHAYTAAGNYTVTLTLNFTHAITGAPMTVSNIKLGYIQVN
jgi:PKD repeat protein